MDPKSIHEEALRQAFVSVYKMDAHSISALNLKDANQFVRAYLTALARHGLKVTSEKMTIDMLDVAVSAWDAGEDLDDIWEREHRAAPTWPPED